MSATVHTTFEDHHEIGDTELVAMVTRGAMLGVPLTYGISLLLSLPGAGWPTAPLIALLPALFAGPWLGSTIVLMSRRAARVPVLATVAPSSPHAGDATTPRLDRAA